MKKTYLFIITFLLLGTVSHAQVKSVSSSSKVRTVTVNLDSGKTIINYKKTLSSAQANQIVQILRNEISDFPKQSLPVKYESSNSHSDLKIRLKKNKVKFKYRSNSKQKKEQAAAGNIQRLKEKFARI